MYSQQKSLLAKASASLVSNNLAVKLNADTGGADLLFLHKSVVHLLLSGAEPYCYNHRHVVCKVPSGKEQVSFVLILQVTDNIECSQQIRFTRVLKCYNIICKCSKRLLKL